MGRLKTNKVKPSQVIKSLSTVIKPEGIAIPIPSSGHANGSEHVEAAEGEAKPNGIEATATFPDRTARARQVNAEETAETRQMYEARKQEIQRSLYLLSKRDEFLKRAIEQADALPNLHQVDETEDTAVVVTAAAPAETEVPEADGKKSKRKKIGKKGKTTAAEKAAADERPCGFDLRFMDDDALGDVSVAGVEGIISRVVEGDVEMRNGDLPSLDHMTTVCLAPRRKCDRHAGCVLYSLRCNVLEADCLYISSALLGGKNFEQLISICFEEIW